MAAETANGPSFDALQRWLQDVIVDPRADETVETDHAARAAMWVKPSSTLAPYERLMVYRDGYLMRMEEALSYDFGGVKRFVGDDCFWRMVAAYVAVHPSQHYNLNRLSDHFPQFVAQWADTPRRAFCTELAHLELAVARVFDAPPSPPVSAQALAAVAADAWDRVRLRPIAALELHSFQYPVDDYLQALLDEAPAPSTARRATHVVVFRPAFDMVRRSLTRVQATVLRALLDGESLFEAFSRGTAGRGRAEAGEVSQWIASWLEDSMFTSLQVD